MSSAKQGRPRKPKYDHDTVQRRLSQLLDGFRSETLGKRLTTQTECRIDTGSGNRLIDIAAAPQAEESPKIAFEVKSSYFDDRALAQLRDYQQSDYHTVLVIPAYYFEKYRNRGLTEFADDVLVYARLSGEIEFWFRSNPSGLLGEVAGVMAEIVYTKAETEQIKDRTNRLEREIEGCRELLEDARADAGPTADDQLLVAIEDAYDAASRAQERLPDDVPGEIPLADAVRTLGEAIDE